MQEKQRVRKTVCQQQPQMWFLMGTVGCAFSLVLSVLGGCCKLWSRLVRAATQGCDWEKMALWATCGKGRRPWPRRRCMPWPPMLPGQGLTSPSALGAVSGACGIQLPVAV